MSLPYIHQFIDFGKRCRKLSKQKPYKLHSYCVMCFPFFCLSRFLPLQQRQPTQLPMLRRPLGPLKEQRDEESHLVRRRKAQRGLAVPLVPQGAKLRTPLRMTSFLGSVRHLPGRKELCRQTRILYTCLFKASISSFL